MADFYRATKIELLDREHPGLKDFVDAQLTAGVSQYEICSMLEELYGEKCKVNPQTMSNYYRLVWWKAHNADIESWRNAKNQFRVLKEEAAKDPECDSAKMIELLTINGIVQQREQVAATDPLKLMAELRKSRQAEADADIRRGELQLQLKQAETAQQQLELKVKQFDAQRQLDRKAVKNAVEAKDKDPDALKRRIDEIYGILPFDGNATGDTAAVSGPVGG